MILNLDTQFSPITGDTISHESFFFNGGEPHIRIDNIDTSQDVILTHRIQSFNDVGMIAIAVDALRRMGVKNIELVIPYFPAARQDRVMVAGESLAVKVYADLINNLNLNKVTIFDPHSDVAPALLNNCTVLTNHDFVRQIIAELDEDIILISPDAGASKKIFGLAKALQMPNVLECGKKRDVITGKLSGFTVPGEDLNGKPCIIVDDICDGGGTFLGLGKELKKKGAGDLYLAVSHGIFSKGMNDLSEIFLKVFTTDSFKSMDDEAGLVQIPLSKIIDL